MKVPDSYSQVKRERKRDMGKKEKTRSVSAYMNQFGKYFRKNWQLYIIFLLPGLLLTLIFTIIPTIRAFLLSLTNATSLGLKSKFVFMEN